MYETSEAATESPVYTFKNATIGQACYRIKHNNDILALPSVTKGEKQLKVKTLLLLIIHIELVQEVWQVVYNGKNDYSLNSLMSYMYKSSVKVVYTLFYIIW